MRDTFCSVLFLAASVFGVIRVSSNRDVAPAPAANEPSGTPTVLAETGSSAEEPDSDDCTKAEQTPLDPSLQVASEVGQLKKADLLIGRRLQSHIEETKTQQQAEANARSQLATDVQMLRYEKDNLSRQLADLRSQLHSKADQSELEKLGTGLQETREQHDRLIQGLETQLADVTDQLQRSTETVDHATQKPDVDETPNSAETFLYSFTSTAGDAMLFEKSNGVMEVDFSGTRHPVMVRPVRERCGHFRSLTRNLATSDHGIAEFGYLDHYETIGGRRLRVKGYVVFSLE